jgi:adenylate kinase family enzyme
MNISHLSLLHRCCAQVITTTVTGHLLRQYEDRPRVPGSGAGKGTQVALIAAHFDLPHIATAGELLRSHVARRTALGQAVQKYLDRGELVPDQVVLDMLREVMVAAKAAGGGHVLDGIPRNMHRAARPT